LLISTRDACDATRQCRIGDGTSTRDRSVAETARTIAEKR
jgi:hypothetical protein